MPCQRLFFFSLLGMPRGRSLRLAFHAKFSKSWGEFPRWTRWIASKKISADTLVTRRSKCWNTCSSRTNFSASTSKNRRNKSFVFYHSEVSSAILCVCYRFVFCLSEIISVILWFCTNMKCIAHNRTDLDEPYWTALNQTGPNRSLRGNPTIKTAYSSEFSKTSCWAIEYSVK